MGSLLPGWESVEDSPVPAKSKSIPIDSVPWWLQEPGKLNLIRQSPGLMRTISPKDAPGVAKSHSPPRFDGSVLVRAGSAQGKSPDKVTMGSPLTAHALHAERPSLSRASAERPRGGLTAAMRRPSLSRDAGGHLKMLVSDHHGHEYDAHIIAEEEAKKPDHEGWWNRMDSGVLNEDARDAAIAQGAAFKSSSYQPQTHLTGQAPLTSLFAATGSLH